MLYTAHIDRPLGTAHPRNPEMIYPVNYGYIPGIIAGDGAEQDVYILGVKEPLQIFTGELIAIIHRRDDVEDKWVLAPEGMRFTKGEIMEAVRFQEQFFDSYCVLDEQPLTCIYADESNRELTRSMVLDYLRWLHCDPPGYEYGEEMEEGIRYFVEKMDKTMVIVLDGERPIACAALGYVPYEWRFRQPKGKQARLMYVYAIKEYRHSHVIRRMIQLLHQEARRRGVREIVVHATEASSTACTVCKALGYHEEEDDDMMCFDLA